MKHGIRSMEHEIVTQILLSELAFDICKLTPIIPGRGSDMLPYFYNLNYTKGLISLHSLLLSNEEEELSIKNYIKQHKKDFPKVDVSEFEEKISVLAQKLKKVTPFSLRHKVGAHIDGSFAHSDYASAYIMPSVLDQFREVVSELKDVYFPLVNHSIPDDPYRKIREQAEALIKTLLV